MKKLATWLLPLLIGCRPGAAEPRSPVADVYSVIVVPPGALSQTARFYREAFQLDAAFESSWFVALGHGTAFALALMSAEHPSSPPDDQIFDGRGAFVTIQVHALDDALARVRARGTAIEYGPVREPWGQRRFVVRDPAGTMVDVVEQVEPAPGFWDRYAPKP